ncbi:hypothetical protein C1708_32970 [Streptomyces sp. DH-12]|nr:hypothetical protein C1708_32970 [Streptomyces sp. DH-12]
MPDEVGAHRLIIRKRRRAGLLRFTAQDGGGRPGLRRNEEAGFSVVMALRMRVARGDEPA